MIFLDETESLVRIYEREAENDDVIETATVYPAAITVNSNSPYSDGTPSLSTFRSPPVSFSPSSTKLHSQPQPSSQQKLRKLIDEDAEDERTYHGSLTAFTNTNLHFSPSASHHSHNTSYDFESAFGVPGTGSWQHSPPTTTSELHSESTKVSPGIESELSPTYVETAIWPLSSIEEAKLMRYFVDHLAVWVRLQTFDLWRFHSNDSSYSLIFVILYDTLH